MKRLIKAVCAVALLFAGPFAIGAGEVSAASFEAPSFNQAPVQLQTGTINACCNENAAGGLTGCIPPLETGGCPGSMVSAKCTSRDVSGLPTNCTKNP